MKKLAFLMSALLLFTIVAPAQAAVESWVKYTYNHYKGISDPVYTGSGDVLVEDLEIDYDSATYQQVYNYDVVKLNKQGVKNTKQLENGLNKLVHYNGKAYVLFFNYAKKQLEVYDEEFVLIDTEPFNLYSESRISIYQSDEYIRFAASTYGESQGFKSSLIYDLKQLKLVENVSLPTVTYEILKDYENNTHTLYFYNALKIANKEMSLASILGSESFADNNLFEFKDTLTFLSTDYSDGEDTASIYTISKEGSVLHHIELPKIQDYWDAIQKNGTLYLKGMGYDSNNDYKPTFEHAVYDLKTNELTLNQPENPIFNQTNLNSSYTAQTIEKNDYYSIVVKNEANEEMYTLHNVFNHPDVLSDYYFAVMKYDSQIGRMTQIIETATGKVVKEYSSASIHKLSDDSFYAVEFFWDEVNDRSKYTGEVIQIQPLVPSPPVTPVTYDPDKKWTVTFSADVDEDTVTFDSLYVTNAQGDKMRTTHKVEGDQVYIFAPTEGYVSGETYTLYVDPSIQSKQGQTLKSGQTKQFTIK